METFGKYQILRRLGQGGMAEVFLAREPLAGGLAKTLVIKKIQPGLAEAREFRQMFEDEAKLGVLLNHPNIVHTYSYGQIGRAYYLALEHVEGLDLLRLTQFAAHSGRRVPPGLAAYIVQQVCKGLDYAHRKSDDFGEPLYIVHRDVSPQNVLVSFDGAVKLVDFGIARVRGQKDDGRVKGKFAYMAPEQVEGLPVDRRSDIFSTGIVLWELVTGKALFGRLPERQALEAIRRGQIPSPRELEPTLPEPLERILLRALARRPEERQQTARDLQNELGHFFFQLGSQEGVLYESGALAAFIAQVVPTEARAAARSLRELPAAETSPGRPSHPGSTAVAMATPPMTPSPRAGTPASSDEGSGGLRRAPRERKGVVVVEGRLDGLPALRRSVGDERARSLLLDFLRVAEHVAYKHRARIQRLDERGYACVLGLPVSAEDDPLRAILLAFDLNESLDGLCRELRPPLHLGSGLESGLALVAPGDGPAAGRLDCDIVAPTDRLARRLAEEALPGEVLAGPALYRAARSEWRFEELDPVEVAGDGEGGEESTGLRSRAFRILGRLPREERLTAAADVPLGRDLELRALAEIAADVATHRRGRQVVVLGDHGVGKRTLVAAFCARLDPSTHRVLRARASAARRDVPWGLLAELARDLLAVPDEVDPRALRRRIEGALEALFEPGDRRRRAVAEALGLLFDLPLAGADEIDPEERRHRLYQALRAVGERLARRATLVLMVEDLHFADRQSFELVHALVHDPLPQPVLVVVTARGEGGPPRLEAEVAAGGAEVDEPLESGSSPSAGHPPDSDEARLDRLLAGPAVVPIFLGELAPAAQKAMLRRLLENPLHPDVAALGQAVLERAGGNPFYIHEILESLAEGGTLRSLPDDGRGGARYALLQPEAAIAVPPSVEAVVAWRFERLPDEERATLRAAAVLGRRFRAADLETLLGAPLGPEVPAILERLIQRRLLEAGDPTASRGRIGFRSAVTQEVAYAGLPDDVRADLHRRAAALLLGAPAYHRGADDGALARHLESAGDHLGAARAYGRAAAYAREVSGNVEAYRLYSRALELLPDEPARLGERFDLHAGREQLLAALGRRDAQLREITSLRRLAEALDDTRRLAQVSCRHAAYLLDGGKHAAGRREIARALEAARAAGDEVTTAAAYRLDATLLCNIGSYGEARERIHAALEALGGREDRAALLERGEILDAMGQIQEDRGRGQSAERAYSEALALYRRLGHRRREAATARHLGAVARTLGDYEAAVTHSRQALALDEERGDRAGLGATLAQLGATYLALGDLDRAQRYLLRALELHEALGDRLGLAEATIALGQLALRRGDREVAGDLLERGLEHGQAARSRYQEIRALVYLAFCRLGEEPAAALDLARSAVKLAREADIPSGLAFGRVAVAQALAAAGHPVEAAAEAAAAAALLEQAVVDGSEEILLCHARLAGAAGEHQVAATAWARAVAEVERKSLRLRDPVRRRLYLEQPLIRAIREGAAQAHSGGG